MTESPIYAIVWLSLILIVILSLTGFLTYSMPVYYVWIMDVNIMRFTLLALLINEFDGLEFIANDGTVVAGNFILIIYMLFMLFILYIFKYRIECITYKYATFFKFNQLCRYFIRISVLFKTSTTYMFNNK